MKLNFTTIKNIFEKKEKTLIKPYLIDLAISKIEYKYTIKDVACIITTSIRINDDVKYTKDLIYETVESKILHNGDFTILKHLKMVAFAEAFKSLIELLEKISTSKNHEAQWNQLIIRGQSPTNWIEYQEDMEDITDKDLLNNMKRLFNKYYSVEI